MRIHLVARHRLISSRKVCLFSATSYRHKPDDDQRKYEIRGEQPKTQLLGVGDDQCRAAGITLWGVYHIYHTYDFVRLPQQVSVANLSTKTRKDNG